MKPALTRHLFLSAYVLTVALALTACGRKEGDSHAHESGEMEHAHEGEPGVTFNAKKGLLVPPDTAKFIGLQVADVEERKIAAAFQFSAQVYRAASEARFATKQPIALPRAQASGFIAPTEAALLREGQAVSIIAGDSVKLSGRITALNHALAKTVEQVEVLLTISDEQSQLANGTFVSVTASFGGETNVVSVPRSALLRTTEGDCVYTVNGDYFARIAVKLGLTDGEFTEVTDGLFAGDKVVVHPVMTLWMTELHNVKGGDACCIAPVKGK